MNPRLLPIRVMACALDPTTRQQWAFQQPNYETIGGSAPFGPIWGQVMRTKPFPGRDSKPGLCLGWSVPPGFSNRLHDDDPQSLPILPDRWLVVRFARLIHDEKKQWQNKAPIVTSWIIDAGVDARDPQSAPILLTVNGKLVQRRVGIRRSLSEAAKHGPTEERIRLNARGTHESSDITFTAFSPSNLNNLSCVDTLDDLPPEYLERGALSYLVVGWYRDTKDDPLQILQSLDTDDNTVTQWRKALELGDTDVASFGDRCIFHGMVTFVDYWNDGSYLGPAVGAPGAPAMHPSTDTPDLSPVKIGFGATVEAAMSALLSDRAAVDDTLAADFDRLLRGIFHDRLARLDVAGSTDFERHAEQQTMFNTIARGSEWTIIRAKPAQDGKSPALSLDEAHQSLLDELNRAQAIVDENAAEWSSSTETLYAIWWLAAKPQTKEILTLQAKWIAKLRELDRERNRSSEAVQSKRIQLQDSLDASFGAEMFVVHETPLPGFFVPKEPAIAIRNAGPKLPQRALSTTGRSLHDVASKWIADGKSVEVASVKEALNPSFGDIQPAIDALALEAALAEAATAGLLRANALAPNSSARQWRDRMNALSQKLDGAGILVGASVFDIALEKPSLSNANGHPVPLGDICAVWTQQPWAPIFLDWEVKWLADQQKNPVTLKGRTILASRPQNILRARLEEWNNSAMQDAKSTAAQLLDRSKHLLQDALNADLLAQSLGGLHQQLLLRDDALPRLQPLDDELRRFVESTALAPPSDTISLPFDSIRRGSLQIEKLAIIDRFGQVFSPVTSTILPSIPNGSNRRKLPNRCLEPMRVGIHFDIPSTARHAIRGWILPSLVDKSIILYHADASPLGILDRLGGDSVVWHPATASAPKSVDGLIDPDLRKFAQDLVGQGAARARFDALLALVDRMTAKTSSSLAPEGFSTISLFGRPLVLLRADLLIQRRGDPIVDPTPLFDGQTPEPGKDSPALAVRVWIGCRGVPDDGVIAFRRADGPPEFLQTAKLDGAAEPPFSGESLLLDTPRSTGANRVSVMLLCNPWGKIYIESDLLPPTVATLPTFWYSNIGHKLPAVLRVNPALIASTATLREIFDHDDSNSLPRAARIDLPLPVGPSDGASSNENASTDARAIFFTEGVDVPVDAITPLATVPEQQVAAIEGVLVF